MKIKNKKRILIVLGILTVLLSVIGISYAFYSARIKENNKTETVIKTNELNIVFTGTQEINCSNIIPGDSCIKKFTVENTSNVLVNYNIYMEKITNEFNEDLVYTLEDNTGSVIEETPLPVTNQNKSYLKTSINIEPKSKVTYTLKILYKYLETPQNDYQGKIFKATVGIDTELVDETYSMYGTVYKNENNNKILVTEGNLVFFSEHQDVSITSDGKFEATHLETGNHEVYYMGNTDASNMTKEEVKTNALCTSTFKMATSNNEIILDCKNEDDNYSINDIEIKKEDKVKYINFVIDEKEYQVQDGTNWSDFISNNGESFVPYDTMKIYKSTQTLAEYQIDTYLDSKNKKYPVYVTDYSDWLTLLYETKPNLSKKYPKLKTSSAGLMGYKYNNLIKIGEKIGYKNSINILNSKVNTKNVFALSSILDSTNNPVNYNDIIKEGTYSIEKIDNNTLEKVNYNLINAYNGYTEDYYECEYVTSFNNGGASSGNIYYSDQVKYENGTYTLVDPKLFNVGSDTTTLVGKYSTFSNSSTSNNYMFKIGSLSEKGSVAEYYVISGGVCYTEDYFDCKYIVSTSDGGPSSGNIYYSSQITYENGTYTLVDPKLFKVGSDTTTLIGKYSTFSDSSKSSSYMFRIGNLTESGAVGKYYVIAGGMC